MSKLYYPSYRQLSLGKLKKRARQAAALLNPCRLCPRRCGVDRRQGGGFCQVGVKVKIASFHPHFGEETVLVGRRGSGTIFFSSCNLACVYCQNWEISQRRVGQEVNPKQLAEMMLALQRMGCCNINLVSPTIWVPQILAALCYAIPAGLSLPLVYNTGGYDAVETLRLLTGIIDIYLPDLKYSKDQVGQKYSGVVDYWSVAKKAILEMHRQVGDLVIKRGLAIRGLLVRHLVLPHNLAGTKGVVEFLTRRVSPNTAINIMDQYHPAFRARKFPLLARPATSKEFLRALGIAQQVGLRIIK